MARKNASFIKSLAGGFDATRAHLDYFITMGILNVRSREVVLTMHLGETTEKLLTIKKRLQSLPAALEDYLFLNPALSTPERKRT